MNSEPCVKLGIRISPKISEKPADSRNNRPPNVTLLTASTSQKVMFAGFPRSSCQKTAGACATPAEWFELRLERREVARVDRLREELLLVVGPELTHVVIGLDRLVDVFAAGLFDTADEEVADHVAEVIELDRSARRIGER